MSARRETYSRCRKCGHREDGVCAVMYGHTCAECGALDSATITTSVPNTGPKR